MRLFCHLRTIRGDRSMAELARQANINPGELSKIEAGRQLPRDIWVPALELAYGAHASDWYEPGTLLEIQKDEAARD